MIRVSEIYKLKEELDDSQNVLMYGPQCSGKTTLARELTDFSYISLGQSVRESTDSKLLRQSEDLIRCAAPWPAELGLNFIARDLRNCFDEGHKVLLDGYPRKIDEYELLIEWLRGERLPAVDTFLEVTAKRDQLLARYTLREARNFESRNFFDLRYQLYEKFRRDIAGLAIRSITYDTTIRMDNE